MQAINFISSSVFVGSLFVSTLVQAQTPSIGLVPDTIVSELAAVIKAPNTAVLSSQSEGLIKQVYVQEGDSFRQGDILLSLDCTLQNASLAKAKAHYNYADKEYQSIKALAKLNSASEMQIALGKSEFDKAAADLLTSRYYSRQCLINAPYDGSVVRSWVNPHENIEAKGKLLEIVNNGQLVAEFLAPSSLLTSLEPGKPIELRVNETQQSYGATITRVVPHIDSVTQTIKVIGTFDAVQPELWSGMSGWVVFH